MATRTAKTGIRHGYTGYTVHQCGCDICRAAFREYKQDYRSRKREERAKKELTVEEIKQPPPDPGTWEDEVPPPKPAKKAAKKTPAKKATPRTKTIPNPTLLGVQRDLRNRNVYESAPGIAAVAERLAVIIDNPLALPQAPAAAARLLDIYKEVGISIKPRGGKLATVKSMMSNPPDEEQQAS